MDEQIDFPHFIFRHPGPRSAKTEALLLDLLDAAKFQEILKPWIILDLAQDLGP